MKGLLNLLTLLAALLNLTTGCGLRRRGDAAAGLLQLSRMVAGGSLGGGSGATVATGLSSVLAGSSRRGLLGRLGSAGVSSLSGGAPSITSALGSSGASSGLGALAAGLGGGTGGTLLSQVGAIAVGGLSRGGSTGGIGSISGGNEGLLLRQGLQQAGQAFARGMVVSATSTGRSSTRFAGSIRENSASNVVGVGGTQNLGLPVGGILPGGSLPASNIPLSGIENGAVSEALGARAGPAVGLLGGAAPGEPSAGLLPGGVSSSGTVSASTISHSAINTVQTLGQNLQPTVHPSGAGSLGVGSAAMTSMVAAATRLAGGTTGNLISVNAHPNGAGSGGALPNGGTRTAPTGAGPGMNTVQGAGQPLRQVGQTLDGISMDAGAASITSAAQISRSAMQNSLDVRARVNGGGSRGIAMSGDRAPLPGRADSGQGASLEATNTARLLGGLVGTVENGLGQDVPSSGSIYGSRNSISGTSLGQRPSQGGQPMAQQIGTGSLRTTSSTHQSSTTFATNVARNTAGNGINMAQRVGQTVRQVDNTLGGLSTAAGAASIISGAQITSSAIQNALNVPARVNGGDSGGVALSRGRGPLPGPAGSGQGATLGATNTVDLLSGLAGTAADSLGQGVSTSGTIYGARNSISGANLGQTQGPGGQPINQQTDAGSLLTSSVTHQSAATLATNVAANSVINGPGFPADPNQGRGPGQGVHPIDQQSGGGSLVVSTSSQHSTTRMTTNIQGHNLGNGRNLGQGFGQGIQPVNHALGGGSVVAVSSSSQSSSRWGAQIVQGPGGSLGHGLPSPGSGGTVGAPSTGVSGFGSPGAGSVLLTAIRGAATGGGVHVGQGTVPGGGMGVLGSSGSSTSVSTGAISGITRHNHQRALGKPSAAATAGLALGAVAGAVALGVLGSTIASAVQSGVGGGGRRPIGCSGGGCRGGCGRKRRSVPQSKVPAEVLNSILTDFNRRY